MNALILDFETTISNKGNPFDTTNKIVQIGLKWLGEESKCYHNLGPGSDLKIQQEVNKATDLVGFNTKFDLHWLRRYNINFSGKRIWDCQIAEFLLGNQKNPYPSLDQAAEKYGFPLKLDVVKNEYWAKGIDTDMIPREILSDYLTQDLVLTEQVYLRQVEQFAVNNKLALFKLQCQDLLVLEEIEANGIKFDTISARDQAETIRKDLEHIHSELSSLVGSIPFNPNSGDHISAILYGGIINEEIKIPIGVYKTGEKTGLPRYKNLIKPYELPRLVTPLPGTEVSKPEGSPPVWKTNSDILRSVKLNKRAKQIVDLLNRYTKLEKLRGTYLIGWSDLIDKMNWTKDMIHGNLNQCTTATGRLSSTKPNLQNADPETKTYCVSRYDS